jgi:orotate phosphoribosyltransferase
MPRRIDKQAFLRKLVNSDVFDPEGVHHEFNQGLHGLKVDLDKVEVGTELFDEWTELTAEFIEDSYDQLPDVLVGVASGTNRLVQPVSRLLANKPLALETIKNERSAPVLSKISQIAIRQALPSFVLVLEDVANVGTNTLSVVRSIQEAGAERIEVLNTLQRSSELELLRANGVSYRSILTHVLPNYTAEECQEFGYCVQGWQLIPYKTKTH